MKSVSFWNQAVHLSFISYSSLVQNVLGHKLKKPIQYLGNDFTKSRKIYFNYFFSNYGYVIFDWKGVIALKHDIY